MSKQVFLHQTSSCKVIRAHCFTPSVEMYIVSLVAWSGQDLNKTWRCINNVCCDSLMSPYFCVTHYCNSELYASNSIFILSWIAFKWREHAFGLKNALPPSLQMTFSFVRFNFLWKHNKLHPNVHKLMGGYNWKISSTDVDKKYTF